MPTTKRTAPKVIRLGKSAEAVAGEPLPLPYLDPTFPIKPWVDARTGLSYHTVSLELDSGAFLCIIAEFPRLRVTAATQSDAEREAIRLYQREQTVPRRADAEDADDLRVIKRREKEPRVSLEKVLAEYGR